MEKDGIAMDENQYMGVALSSFLILLNKPITIATIYVNIPIAKKLQIALGSSAMPAPSKNDSRYKEWANISVISTSKVAIKAAMVAATFCISFASKHKLITKKHIPDTSIFRLGMLSVQKSTAGIKNKGA